MVERRLVLIIEDEADLAELIRFNLEREGFPARVALDGKAGLAIVREHRPDLVILDRMLPGQSGDEVMTQIRRDPTMGKTPIIMLTAKTDESDQLVGFALGADDYITKPFSMKLLLARVAAVFRRIKDAPASSAVITTGPFHLDLERYALIVEERPVVLTATEFKLFKTLMTAGGRVLSRVQLIDAAMGMDTVVTDRTIDVHITSLRKKLGHSAEWIQTIRGIGYTLRPPAD